MAENVKNKGTPFPLADTSLSFAKIMQMSANETCFTLPSLLYFLQKYKKMLAMRAQWHIFV